MIQQNMNTYEYFISHIIIGIFNYFITLYIFIKSTNKNLNFDYSKIQKFLLLILGVLISIIYSTINQYVTEIAQVFLFIFVPLSISLISDRLKNSSLIICLIPECCTHIFKFISYIIVATVGWVIHIPARSILMYFLVGTINFAIAFLLLKVKRFRNGFRFFEDKNNLGVGIIISGFVFVITSIDYNKDYSNKIIKYITILGIIASGFGLYLWIRKGITRHYREKLQLKSEIYYKEQLEQKQQEIERLNKSNELLAKIVHRDNHLMSSLDSSINSYFESSDKDFKDDVLREIHTLATERGEIIKNEQRESKLFPTTGNALIDGAVNDLYIKATAHGIDFDLSVSETVDEVIGKYISQTDLQTLICDHIKDAIIAVDTKNETNGKILVDLSMQDNNYAITIFDSGVDFEIDTLAKLGKERVTTHADNGGSGIGFMTTFETLRKSYASLIITEFENKTPFSKSVSIRFDGNSAFIVRSYRKGQLKTAINRDDVIL